MEISSRCIENDPYALPVQSLHDELLALRAKFEELSQENNKLKQEKEELERMKMEVDQERTKLIQEREEVNQRRLEIGRERMAVDRERTELKQQRMKIEKKLSIILQETASLPKSFLDKVRTQIEADFTQIDHMYGASLANQELRTERLLEESGMFAGHEVGTNGQVIHGNRQPEKLAEGSTSTANTQGESNMHEDQDITMAEQDCGAVGRSGHIHEQDDSTASLVTPLVSPQIIPEGGFANEQQTVNDYYADRPIEVANGHQSRETCRSGTPWKEVEIINTTDSRISGVAEEQVRSSNFNIATSIVFQCLQSRFDALEARLNSEYGLLMADRQCTNEIHARQDETLLASSPPAYGLSSPSEASLIVENDLRDASKRSSSEDNPRLWSEPWQTASVTFPASSAPSTPTPLQMDVPNAGINTRSASSSPLSSVPSNCISEVPPSSSRSDAGGPQEVTPSSRDLLLTPVGSATAADLSARQRRQSSRIRPRGNSELEVDSHTFLADDRLNETPFAVDSPALNEDERSASTPKKRLGGNKKNKHGRQRVGQRSARPSSNQLSKNVFVHVSQSPEEVIRASYIEFGLRGDEGHLAFLQDHCALPNLIEVYMGSTAHSRSRLTESTMGNLKVKVEDLLTFFPGPSDHDADQQNVTFIRFLCNLASDNPHTNSLVGVMRTLNAHSAAREDEKNMLSFFSLSILVLAKLTDNQVQFTEAMDYFDEGRDAKLSAQKEKYFYEILNACRCLHFMLGTLSDQAVEKCLDDAQRGNPQAARTPAFYDAMPTPDSRAANTPNIRRAALTGKKRSRSAVQEAHEQRSPEKRRRLSTTVSEAGSVASDAPSDLHESHECGTVSPCTQNLTKALADELQREKKSIWTEQDPLAALNSELCPADSLYQLASKGMFDGNIINTVAVLGNSAPAKMCFLSSFVWDNIRLRKYGTVKRWMEKVGRNKTLWVLPVYDMDQWMAVKLDWEAMSMEIYDPRENSLSGQPQKVLSRIKKWAEQIRNVSGQWRLQSAPGPRQSPSELSQTNAGVYVACVLRIWLQGNDASSRSLEDIVAFKLEMLELLRSGPRMEEYHEASDTSSESAGDDVGLVLPRMEPLSTCSDQERPNPRPQSPDETTSTRPQQTTFGEKSHSVQRELGTGRAWPTSPASE
nr:hypothetical protein B0A51_16190 [Rachicladosporium sp. CCFEE 5018]